MKTQWIALGYNVPAEPSKSRVYVWRKLREMGAEYLRPGVSILPRNEANEAQFRKLAGRIKEMDGDAVLVEMSFVDEADEQEMVRRFTEQSRSEFARIIEQGLGIVASEERSMGEIGRIERELERARRRDHFGQGLTSEIRSGFDLLISTARGTMKDFGSQLRDMTRSGDDEK